MTIGFKPSNVRITLLATLVAATGAFVAAPVHAGKAPLFDAVYNNDTDRSEMVSCEVSGGRTIAKFTVAGKGKWVFIDWEVIKDGKRSPFMSKHRYDRTEEIVFDYPIGTANTVALVATLVDRKGEAYETPHSVETTKTATCS